MLERMFSPSWWEEILTLADLPAGPDLPPGGLEAVGLEVVGRQLAPPRSKPLGLVLGQTVRGLSPCPAEHRGQD